MNPVNKVQKRIGNHISRATVFAILLVILLLVPSVFAQPTNLDFETGDLTGWTTQGNIEVLQGSNLIPNITPPEGQYFVLLSTGFGNSPAPDGGDLDVDGNPDYDITILSQTFTSGTSTLSFSWSWLTYEETSVHAQYDDFFFARLDGTTILSGSVDKSGDQSPFSNIPTDDVAYSVDSTGSTDQSYFGDGRSSFEVFTYPLSSGTHTIEFIIADAGDDGVDSGLLIDGIPVQEPPEPSGYVPVGGYMIPTNKLAILAPYLAIVGFIGIIFAILTIRKKLKAKIS